MYRIEALIGKLENDTFRVCIPTIKGNQAEYHLPSNSGVLGEKDIEIEVIHIEDGQALIEVPGKPMNNTKNRIWVAEKNLIVPDQEKLDLEAKLKAAEYRLAEREKEYSEILKSKENELLKSQAEFQNTRKRLRKTQEEQLKYASESLIRELLSELDNIDIALRTARTSPVQDVQIYGRGLEMVRNNLFAALERAGVSTIPTQGIKFTPELHEVVETRSAHNIAPFTIVGVHRAGYKLHDRVIRPAQVAVAQAI